MKGVYYYEGIDFSDKNNSGIINKVKNQIKCLKEIGDLTIIEGKGSYGIFDEIRFILPIIESEREKQRKKIAESVTEDTNYIYIRKPSLTKKFYAILNKIKKNFPKIIIIMEIPTYPFHSEYRGISKIMAIKSTNCEKKLHEVIDYIATYSNDSEIWGIKTINLSNCVDYSSIKPRSDKYKIIDRTIRLTCVANFTYWHGLDRLIKGIKEYKGDYKVVLNLVGGGKEIDNLKELSKRDSRIVFHGSKSGKELDDIFDNTDIAVDALGRHRSGVYYNSSLKGKEYSARGVPSISAVKTELDDFEKYKYYLKLPETDEPINISEIVKFYTRVYKNQDTQRVTKEIRERTKDKFDYKYGYKNIIYKIISNSTS